ncbi:MAG: SUMF1/EgtB/PvdO family nonheme iron enzyme [Planctomycetaceae bacterium]
MGTPPLDNPDNPDRIKQDEIPAHPVTVDGFWIDEAEYECPVRRFVAGTGSCYIRGKSPKREFMRRGARYRWSRGKSGPVGVNLRPDFDRENFSTGFPGMGTSSLETATGCQLETPDRSDSSIAGKDDHPVVNVVYEDCVAYCHWAGKRLPTEAEWEFACRAGHEGRKYPWGNELTPDGKYLCNYWQGTFPTDRQNLDGFLDTSPVKSFPPNDFGLYDMSGNVWEWVNDYYRPDYYRRSPPRNPQGPESWLDPHEPEIEKRVTPGVVSVQHQ